MKSLVFVKLKDSAQSDAWLRDAEKFHRDQVEFHRQRLQAVHGERELRREIDAEYGKVER